MVAILLATAALSTLLAAALLPLEPSFGREGGHENACRLYAEHPGWRHAAQGSAERWGVEASLQLAILAQESGFDADARPPRRRILWIFPGPRLSTAFGYAQVVDGTWEMYRSAVGRPEARRDQFPDAVDFVGWYADHIHRETGVAKDDAYGLYLAYHEGPAGYERGSHRGKDWLDVAARRVAKRTERYRDQVADCRRALRRGELVRAIQRPLMALAGLCLLLALIWWLAPRWR